MLTSQQRSRIAICTTTLYKGISESPAVKIRAQLAQEFIRSAAESMHWPVIVDGGSDESFLQGLSDCIAQTFYERQEASGMSEGRRIAFRKAREHIPDLEAVVMTEPEKTDLIRNIANIDRLIGPIVKGTADITILNRTEESFRSLPLYQAQSERAANMILNDLLREHGLLKPNDRYLDLFSGPKAVSAGALHLFERVWTFNDRVDLLSHRSLKNDTLDMYVNSLFFPVYQALKDNLRVVPVGIDLRYPKEQTSVERGDPEFERKRDRQRSSIIMQSIEFLRLLAEGHTRFKLA
jgi:hypothetical protein